MDRDTIIQLAREAGAEFAELPMTDAIVFSVEDRAWNSAALQRFAALVAAHEREMIFDEWWSCVQADLEHGVKFLNEQAAEKWKRDYPQISNFAAAIRSRT